MGQRRFFAEGLPKKLRWFMLPFEAKQILCYGATIVSLEPPFRPTGGGKIIGKECLITSGPFLELSPSSGKKNK